jgi:hypothetical protein
MNNEGGRTMLKKLRLILLGVSIVELLLVIYNLSLRAWWNLSLELKLTFGFYFLISIGGILLAYIVYADGKAIDELKTCENKS